MFDMGFTALIEDLQQRGLLHETLVVAIGEFGRTPKINAAAGRDHWGHVFSFALAGAGIYTGQVYGSSDRDGAFPARDAVTAGDLTATLFHALGVDHESTFRDAEGREHKLTLGSPIRPLLGGGIATYERVAAEGTVSVRGFDTSLLLNTDFQEPVPLYPVDRGSRPKGWRATPILGSDSNAFGVRLQNSAAFGVRRPESADVGRQMPHAARAAVRQIAIGFGLSDGKTPICIQKGELALLGQEMRNPRAGQFTFTVEASICGCSKELCEIFAKHFTCRLVMYRFADLDKNPLKRQELGSLAIQPPLVVGEKPARVSFELTQRLDSAGPGQNFSIGRGLGVAIEVLKTADGPLELSSGQMGGVSASLRISSAQLRFASHTINDKVVV